MFVQMQWQISGTAKFKLTVSREIFSFLSFVHRQKIAIFKAFIYNYTISFQFLKSAYGIFFIRRR